MPREPIITGDCFPTAVSWAGLLSLSCASTSRGKSFLNTVAWTNPGDSGLFGQKLDSAVLCLLSEFLR